VTAREALPGRAATGEEVAAGIQALAVAGKITVAEAASIAAQAIDAFRLTEPDTSALMKPGEVAAAFKVDPKTVTRWARAGRLHPIRTLGGHRRYRTSEVEALLNRGEAGA
jgi:excisionase family DNA binding protein